MLGKGHGGLSKAPTKKEESERLRVEGDQVKFVDLRFELNSLDIKQDNPLQFLSSDVYDPSEANGGILHQSQSLKCTFLDFQKRHEDCCKAPFKCTEHFTKQG